MDDFINVIKRDPKIQTKLKDMLDKYNRLLYNYQLEIGYDTLIQNVILEEIVNLTGASIVDTYFEIKWKIVEWTI